MFRKVQHPNLSCLLGLQNVDQGIAILSPLVKGRNLHDHIFSQDKFKVCSGLCAMKQIVN